MLTVLCAVYVLGTLALFLYNRSMWSQAKDNDLWTNKDRRSYARWALAAPLWPLIAVVMGPYLLVRTVVALIKDAR